MEALRTAQSDAVAPGMRGGSSRPSRGLLAVAATVAGCLGISAALGLALPRSGGSATAIALIALGLAAGIVLLGASEWLLVRATQGWGRLVLLPWLVLVLVAVYCVSIAFAAAYSPRPATGSLPSGAVAVVMTAADGTELAGWYLPSRNGAAVVLRHGAGSHAGDTVDHARMLHDAGYGVLATDARGHGASAGQAMDLGWYGESDIGAAVDHLLGRTEVTPARIGVVGLSMGGEEAIGAAGVDDRICAVVAEGATGRTAQDKRWLADEYGAAGVVQGWLDAVTYRLIDLLVQPAPPASLAASIDAAEGTAFLLIAAGDVRDEQLVAERLEKLDPDAITVWTVAGAPHVGGLRQAPEEWVLRVTSFLDPAFDGCERERSPLGD